VTIEASKVVRGSLKVLFKALTVREACMMAKMSKKNQNN
jgi:hypothetical protein